MNYKEVREALDNMEISRCGHCLSKPEIEILGKNIYISCYMCGIKVHGVVEDVFDLKSVVMEWNLLCKKKPSKPKEKEYKWTYEEIERSRRETEELNKSYRKWGIKPSMGSNWRK